MLSQCVRFTVYYAFIFTVLTFYETRVYHSDLRVCLIISLHLNILHRR